MRGLTERTKESYFSWLARLVSHANLASLNDINSEHVSDFLHYQLTHAKAQNITVKQAFYSFRLYFRDHLKKKGNDWSIWEEFKIKTNKSLPHVLTQGEVTHLLKHVKKGRYRSVLTTMYLCGLRISEVVSLKPEHINGQRRIVRIENSKGGKSREIPLCEEHYHKLRKHWSYHRNKEWLFPAKVNLGTGASLYDRLQKSEKHIEVATLRQVFNKTAKECGLKDRHDKLTPHTLRHSYATHLIEQGACIRAVSAYLGHSSLETTMIYLHMTQVSEQRARQVISGLAQKQL